MVNMVKNKLRLQLKDDDESKDVQNDGFRNSYAGA